ncbi:hypothetical protein AeNC1_007090 [Aphanomyces euteiches]|nr:hypothetical protein AeNC1_007090 [Aphanomyces euteiches]
MSTRSKEETLPLVVQEAPRGGTNHKLLGLLWVGLSALSLSLLFTTIKYESVHLSAMQTVFWLSSIAWILNLVAVLSTRTSLFVPDELRIYVAVRCGCGFVFFSCATWAISHMVLSDASVLIFTAPILLFFLGVAFLKDKVECIYVVCALVGLGGALFVIRPVFLFQSKQIVQVASTLAIVSALVAALAKAAAFVLLRHLPTLHYLVAIHYLMLTCSLFSGIWIALDERVFHYEMDLYAWLGVGAIGVLGFLGKIGLTKGAHVENVGLAFVLRYLGVVLVFVWDALLLLK